MGVGGVCGNVWNLHKGLIQFDSSNTKDPKVRLSSNQAAKCLFMFVLHLGRL